MKSDNTYVLDGITLKIRKGEKLAIVGRTGSGKSSILNALFRLYPICEGEIYVNGNNIVELSLQELRQHMAIIPQFGFLYNASLRDNLDPEGIIQEQKI